MANDVRRPVRLWSPRDLGSALSCWFDAADPTTITIATGVSQWLDKSGRSNLVTQAVALAQPSYSPPSGASSLGSVVCTTAQAMSSAAFAAQPLTSSQAYSFFFVGQATTSSFGSIINLGGSRFQIITNPGGGSNNAVFFQQQFGGNLCQVNNINNNQNYIMCGTQIPGSQAFYLNGSAAGTGSSVTSVPAPTSIQLGGSLGLIINEVIVIPYVITLTQRQQIEGYLAWKWGQASLLPATHAYKYAPPKRLS